ncbi:MAG: hypothetical protein QOF68_2152 [Gaiellales bacterium]|nr:hypothetical protein [Gaiellales bacterium]
MSSSGGGKAELAWLSAVLWAGHGLGPSNGRYAILPSAARPRLLVPLGSRRAGATALTAHTSSRRVSRLFARVLAAGFHAGVSGHLLRSRAGPAQSDRSAELLENHIQEVMGQQLYMAVFFQTGRPQKKPVLQLITPGGALVGYAKVGWNDVTRRLVRREGEALEQVARALPRDAPFGVPPVRYRGTWRGHELLITDAVGGVGRGLLADPPIDATATLAQLSVEQQEALPASRYWCRQRARIEATTSDSARALGGAVEESVGSGRLKLGFVHGDWVPWNMARCRDGRLLVWDWEWSIDSAPVGLDALQWLFQVELNLRHRRPGAAVDHTARAALELLARLGIPAALVQPLLAMHVIESILRLEEARSGGVGAVISTQRYDIAAERLLERMA